MDRDRKFQLQTPTSYMSCYLKLNTQDKCISFYRAKYGKSIQQMVGCTLQRLLTIAHISPRDAAESEDIKAGLRVPGHQTALSSLSHLLSFPLFSLISQKELKGKELRLSNGHQKLSFFFFTTSCPAMTYQIPLRRYCLILSHFLSLPPSLSLLFGHDEDPFQ